MSVLINGMQMPKCCRECDAEGHYDNSYGDEYGFFCPFGYKAYTSETRELKRLDNCPLVPVPPHYDLIDHNALKRAVMDCDAETRLDFLKHAMDCINKAPVVIPSDMPTYEEEDGE